MLNTTRSIAMMIILFLLAGSLIGCADELPDEGAETAVTTEKQIPIEAVFHIVAAENDAARSLYTSQIVGGGKAVGLTFDEDWREAEVQAGPLPALFLREASASVQRSSVPLGLFLGSNFPIQQENEFSDLQLEKFTLIRQDGAPQFFLEETSGLYTAMFKDIAVAAPCVECHNAHPETPKTDWELGDVMGATTWTYSRQSVTPQELYDIIQALRQGFRDAYDAYLDEVATFDNPPEIGQEWPGEDAYALPTTDVFMARFEELASPATLQAIMEMERP